MFIFLAIAACCSASSNMKINEDLAVSGVMSCNNLASGYLKATESAHITRVLQTPYLESNSAQVNKLRVSYISSPSGTVVIEGDVIITTQSELATSFIQTSWTLFEHNDFQAHANGWSKQTRSSCDRNDYFLGGHCALSNEEVSKEFSLPSHKYVRVTATYHMIDIWNGEQAFMKLDNKTVWMQTGQTRLNNPNICGGSSPDARYSIPVDVTIPHSTPKLVVEFGSTLQTNPCDGSFAIDDVMIYVMQS